MVNPAPKFIDDVTIKDLYRQSFAAEDCILYETNDRNAQKNVASLYVSK
jgi:hypothetical protein